MSYFSDYVTYKYVVLKDARLAVTYYTLVALILLYSAVDIFFNKGYLQVRVYDIAFMHKGRV